MAKRVKSDNVNLQPVTDWEHADQIVKNIADRQLKINAAEHKAIDDINEAKAELAAATKPLQEQIKQDIARLEAFALAHKDDFKKQKSMKLNFGALGWRQSTSTKIKKTTLELIKKIYSAAKAKTFLHIKETVDKEALAKSLNDEQLAQVGAKRVVTEIFFVEPDMPEAVDYIE